MASSTDKSNGLGQSASGPAAEGQGSDKGKEELGSSTAGVGQSSNVPPSWSGPGRPGPSSASRHSSAMTQRLRSIDKRNVELFEEITELRKIRGMINVFKSTIEKERKETLQAENKAINHMTVEKKDWVAAFQQTPEQKAADDAFDEEIMEEMSWLTENDTAWQGYWNKHKHEHEFELVEEKVAPHAEVGFIDLVEEEDLEDAPHIVEG